jgi:hypothetical protein
MVLGGPAGINPLQKIEDDNSSLALRVNQRLNGEILQVSGDRVVISVQGVQIVARLASADQAAILMSQRQAAFIVREVAQNGILLQLVPAKTNAPQNNPVQGNLPAGGTAEALLQGSNIMVTPQTLNLARAILDAGIQVTPEILQDLFQTLEGLNLWGKEDIQAAILLKEAGLSITPDTIALFKNNPSEMSFSLGSLQTLIQQTLKETGLLPQLGGTLQTVLNPLDKLVIDVQLSQSEMAENLKEAVVSMGKSLEKALGKMAEGGQQNLQAGPDNLMLSLAVLRKQISGDTNYRELTKAIDHFMEQVRLVQYSNTTPDSRPTQGQWVNLNLPLRLPSSIKAEQQSDLQLKPSQLKVAYRPGGESGKIDPNYTRLIIEVDLEPGQTLGIDLSIVQKKVGAQITTTTNELRTLAEEELPIFSEGLEKLGYHMLSYRFEEMPIVQKNHHEPVQSSTGVCLEA